MQQVSDYTVVKDITLSDLEGKVKSYISQGWCLLGGASHVFDPVDRSIYHYQTLVKYKDVLYFSTGPK